MPRRALAGRRAVAARTGRPRRSSSWSAARVRSWTRPSRSQSVPWRSVTTRLIGSVTSELLAENVNACRWWTTAELRAAQIAYDAAPRDPGVMTFSPRRLGQLVTDVRPHARPRDLLQLAPL